MTLKVGVIGVGFIGKSHIRTINNRVSGASVVAVMDVNSAQASSFLEDEHFEAHIYDDASALINDPNVDAVIVASWGPTHEELVIQCINAGKPVLCEKPLAVTADGCERIIDCEMRSGKKYVQVGFMRRYDAFYGQLKAHLDSKTVGEPLVVNCVHRAPQAPGFSGDMALTDSCVHEYDVLRWLLEEDYASVQVITPKCTTQKTDEYQDPHIILLTTQSGTHISIESFVNCHYGYDIQCRVTGETGELTLPAPASVKVRDQGKYSSDILMDWSLGHFHRCE
jgi:myo-inositol 2-dehydrogenase/D-chiro-inositol 1-dehydrogenase